MPPLKYTPTVIVIIALAYFGIGPAEHLSLLHGDPSLIWEKAFWGDTLAAGLASIGDTYPQLLDIGATALGIPMLAGVIGRARAGSTPPAEPDHVSTG